MDAMAQTLEQLVGVRPDDGRLVLLVSGEHFGRVDDELGRDLMDDFLGTLVEVRVLPLTIVLVHGGVKLAAVGSPVLSHLQTLAGRGVTLLLCGTSVRHFELNDRIVVGRAVDMYAVAETLLEAGRLISV